LLGAPMLDPAHRRMARAFRRATPSTTSLARWLAGSASLVPGVPQMANELAAAAREAPRASFGIETDVHAPGTTSTPIAAPQPAEVLGVTRDDLLRQLLSTTEPEETPPPFAPRFTRPAYELLRDYFPDLLLPGMSGVPANTVALLQTNPAFIEAFMVGLNHEIVREPVWRGFPIARRATLFQRFLEESGPECGGGTTDRWLVGRQPHRRPLRRGPTSGRAGAPHSRRPPASVSAHNALRDRSAVIGGSHAA
jgi:hypothetical protein